jgi:hypothetical protein
MNLLSNFIKTHCPGPLIEASVELQLGLAPSAFYRRRARIHRQAGSPRRVLSGPFKGLVYTRHAADKLLLHRLFGAYECELHGAVERLCSGGHDAVVVAGAGEGYYAVGLARRLPQARVHAYEGYKWARHLLGQMISRNGVAERVRVGGYVSPAELERVLAPAARPALVCDVEGYEEILVDPAVAPSLARATILLELHECMKPGLTEKMRARFSGTHRIDEFYNRPRTAADLPEFSRGASLSREDALWAIDEDRFRRVKQSWFFLEPWETLAGRRAA